MVNRGLSDIPTIKKLRNPIKRNSGNIVPTWYTELEENATVSETNGKSLGSIVEKVVAAVIEVEVLSKFHDLKDVKLTINPAAGVDLPQLSLGIKSPSQNWDTSEPYNSPYERITGNPHDNIVLLTNLQEVKHEIPFKLQILDTRYLEGYQLSDFMLTRIAKDIRDNSGLDEEDFLKICKFLSVLHKSRDADLLKEVRCVYPGDWLELEPKLDEWLSEFGGIISRLPPTGLEYERLVKGPLEGQIGISFALQWRYTFRRTFPDFSRLKRGMP